MNAIRVHEFGPPEVMRLESVPDLNAGPGQVVVGVKAVGVNPADTYVRSGTYSIKPMLPYTPGVDAAGTVDSVGEDVEVAVGTRVYTSGTLTGAYAEQTLCQEANVHALPSHVSFGQGAAINVPYSTTYRALFQRAHGVAGETVLVHGATGGVGIAAVQLARAAEMKVIGTGGTERGRRLVLEQGALQVFDHRAPDYMNQALAATGGQGFDIILEMLANVNLGNDLRILASGGRIVVIGSRGRVEIDPRDSMNREAAILGMLLFNTPKPELTRIHAALAAGLEDGTLKPVVGQEMPLSDAAKAHRAIMEPGAYGKIVLTP